MNLKSEFDLKSLKVEIDEISTRMLWTKSYIPQVDNELFSGEMKD